MIIEVLRSSALAISYSQGLDIHHIGHGLLPSNLKSLYLKIVFHVPAIIKNLLSVKNLTSNNNVLIEFSTDCCVKDKSSGRVLQNSVKKKSHQPRVFLIIHILFIPSPLRLSNRRKPLLYLFHLSSPAIDILGLTLMLLFLIHIISMFFVDK